ncbi:MAG: pantetheine-phosphate adenylyltransferase [Clostridia bacterium]|nr:pantetheine-phosphate adenylyltransferase [Clostridia bacterium]
MRVILPGSYDPITLGHLAIIEAAAEKYSEVFVVAFVNPDKKYAFPMAERVEMIRLAVSHLKNVRVDFSLGRVVDYMREKEISLIVKGYRNERDLEYERAQAEYNLKNGGYETELIKCESSLESISSTLARQGIAEGKNLDKILPRSIINYLEERK